MRHNNITPKRASAAITRALDRKKAQDEHLMWELAIGGGPLRRYAELVVQQTQLDRHMSDGRAAILEGHLRDSMPPQEASEQMPASVMSMVD